MKFKKISVIVLTIVSTFSMSVAPTFAGRAETRVVVRVNPNTSSKTADKKPSSKRNSTKKLGHRIYFCINCGGRVDSKNKPCHNKTCVLSPKNGASKDKKNSTDNIRGCYLSEIESQKEKFPACKECGSHDVKLIFEPCGYSIWCYGEQCRRITERLKFPTVPEAPKPVVVTSPQPVVDSSDFSVDFFDDCGFITGLDYDEGSKFLRNVKLCNFITPVQEDIEHCIYSIDTTVEDKPRIVKRSLPSKHV